MADELNSYREDLFQWIWQNLEFDCAELKTDCGKPITILETGSLNNGAGPDFLGAHIVIDGLEWHGSVEIHKNTADWNRHSHHTDQNYNNVVLHVVYTDGLQKPVRTRSGAPLYTLSLKQRLHKSLEWLLSLKNSESLPCSGQVQFINQAAFEKQIVKTHNEYFEYKAKELLQEYPAGEPVSSAWKICLIRQLFRTLGMPGNREQMLELAALLSPCLTAEQSAKTFISLAEAVAFDRSGIAWNHTGMRPASRPEVRVPQAAMLLFSIAALPLSHFFQHPEVSWQNLTGNIPGHLKPGQSRLNLIYNTNYLPALYLLGDLLHFSSLKNSSKLLWQQNSQFVPAGIIQPFRKAGFELNSTRKKLGLVHQFKRYCSERNCHQCEVFKSAIRS